MTVAKIAAGRAVEAVPTIAHQLHGAIGVTVEHRLWLATMRARSWVDQFGTTAHYARGSAGWHWPPAIPGRSSSAVQHLVDARLDVTTVTQVGQVDAEPFGQRVQHVGGRRDSDRSVFPALWIARLRPRRFQRASSVTVATDNPTTKTDFGCVETYQLPTSRSIRGRGRVVNMYSVCHSPRTCCLQEIDVAVGTNAIWLVPGGLYEYDLQPNGRRQGPE